jgi:hypothetical protein
VWRKELLRLGPAVAAPLPVCGHGRHPRHPRQPIAEVPLSPSIDRRNECLVVRRAPCRRGVGRVYLCASEQGGMVGMVDSEGWMVKGVDGEGSGW